MKSWQDDYKNLNLMSGKISFILEDDEDMIEIHYEDGMLIDVGYIERMHSYLITVVSNDTDEGWENPLEEINIENKAVICCSRDNLFLCPMRVTSVRRYIR